MIGRTSLAIATLAAVLAAGAAAAHGPGTGAGGWNCPYQDGGNPYGMGYGMMGRGMTGHGMMGQGMMGQGMMGQGMMGQGSGPGMMGPGMMGSEMMGQGMMRAPGMMGPDMMGQEMMGHAMPPAAGPGMPGRGMMQPLRADLSGADVRHMMEHRLAMAGNPNVKLGKVEERDADTIVAEVVTQEGSLVERFEIDRHTGWMQPAR